MNIYVGNISHQSSEQDLMQLFSQYGNVKSAKIIKDNYTGQSRGFAFVEMDDNGAATQAIKSLNETEFMGRNIIVNEARPKSPSSGGGNRGGGGGFNRDRNYNRNF
ncbi:MAG TPA: RNA-binding protein [Flavipsychrobacter sp.]|nr:RNA-binding protein [Flavipsychrobacter sp.]